MSHAGDEPSGILTKNGPEAMTLVILILGAVLLVSLIAIAALAFARVPIPDVLQNVAVGSLTSIGSLLVRPALADKNH